MGLSALAFPTAVFAETVRTCPSRVMRFPSGPAFTDLYRLPPPDMAFALEALMRHPSRVVETTFTISSELLVCPYSMT